MSKNQLEEMLQRASQFRATGPQPKNTETEPENESIDRLIILLARLDTLEARQQETHYELVQQQELIEALQSEFAALKAHAGEKTPPAKPTGLPKINRLEAEDCNRIVELRVDFWDNGPKNTRGYVRYKARGFVWFDTKDGKRGHIEPFKYELTEIDADGNKTGCHTIKVKGTHQTKDHTVVIFGDTARLSFGGFEFDCGEHEKPKSKPNAKEDAPDDRWYWNKLDEE